jgi:hypothetical protein
LDIKDLLTTSEQSGMKKRLPAWREAFDGDEPSGNAADRISTMFDVLSIRPSAPEAARL